MATLRLPDDIAGAPLGPLGHCARTPEVAAFRALIASGAAWEPHRVRQLRRVLARNAIAWDDGVRCLTLAAAGFRGADLEERMQVAVVILAAGGGAGAARR